MAAFRKRFELYPYVDNFTYVAPKADADVERSVKPAKGTLSVSETDALKARFGAYRPK